MKNIIIYLFLSLILLTACFNDKQQENFSLKTSVKVFRFDRLQYEAVALNSFTAQQKMSLDFPQGTKLLIEDVLGLGLATDPSVHEKLYAYYSDSTLMKLMEDAENKYMDMSGIEKQLTDGFRRLKKEVPEIAIPRFYAQISALNQSVVVGDSLLGFSIDKYMGEDYPLYRKYYYAYQRRTMNPERIVPDCLTFYLFSYYPFRWLAGHRSLSDILMHQGKVYWVVKNLLKLSANGEVLGYTDEEQEWCEENEKKIWAWMKTKGHLSTTDPMIIRAYTHADPSAVFGRLQVPPVVGVWLGMQQIDRFMKQHPKMTIKELLEYNSFEKMSLD